MGKKKSLYTVKEATAMAFKTMGEVFQTYELIAIVRGLLARPYLMDGTILRRLRELREDHPTVYGYEVIDAETSKYKKRKLEPAKAI